MHKYIISYIPYSNGKSHKRVYLKFNNKSEFEAFLLWEKCEYLIRVYTNDSDVFNPHEKLKLHKIPKNLGDLPSYELNIYGLTYLNELEKIKEKVKFMTELGVTDFIINIDEDYGTYYMEVRGRLNEVDQISIKWKIKLTEVN